MDRSDGDRPRFSLSRADNRLVRAIGRVPTTVQRKLLFAFGIVVVLLITVGVLGIGVLSQSNDRVQTLGTLPQREAAYRQLAIDSDQLSSLLGSRGNYVLCLVAPNPLACPTGEIPAYAASASDIDGEIYLTLTQLSLLIDKANLGFSPPPKELRILTEVGSEYRQIAAAMATLIGGDQHGVFSKPEAEQDQSDVLVSNADRLVGLVQSATANLIAQNQAAYLDSQHLVIGVATGSVVLALVLGLALSRSLTGPIRTMDTRLAGIAAGDFSGHVDVTNRDELGALAVNLNRMNDQLGRLYHELETASRHKSEFLSNMSHELRTPLNAVIGFSEVLQDGLFGDLNDKQADYVADIHTSGRHLLTLINDILDLSKVEAGRMELQVSAFALSDVLENAVTLMRERATRQGISLCLTVDPSTGAVGADERKIKQVLFNLLTNALKFTTRGGHVEITARGDGDEVVVSVRDDGVGIAQADQVRIFEEFRQVGASQPEEGTGLGLALSRSFVELHGGRLWVESEPGQGSTFMFNLPRIQGAGATAKNDGPRNREAGGVEFRNAALLS